MHNSQLLINAYYLQNSWSDMIWKFALKIPLDKWGITSWLRMTSAYDVMNVITWLFLEAHYILAHHSLIWMLIHHPRYEVGRNKFGTRIMWNLLTRISFLKTPHDQVDEIIDQLLLAKKIPNVSSNFISCQEMCK